MSSSLGDAVLELRADVDPLKKDLASAKKETEESTKGWVDNAKDAAKSIATALAIVTGVVYGIAKALDATVGAFVKYADQVRDISMVTGQSAEEVSRMIQVTDDYKISTESLNTVMRKMATEGMPLTIDALAQLSDKYLKLAPGVERQIFLTETFGRQGVDFAEIMLAGGDAIRAQADAIADNLILTDAAVQKARDYEIAQDNLHDSVQGLKIAIGEGLTPVVIAGTEAITTAINETQLYSRAQELGIDIGRNFWNGQVEVNGEFVTQSELLRLVTQAEWDNADATNEGVRALAKMKMGMDETIISTDMFTGAIIDSNKALQQEQAEFGFIISFAKQYESNLANITTAEGNLRQAEDDLAAARAKWPEGNQHIIDAQTAVDGLKAKLGDAQQASLDATNEMIAGFLQAQLTADGSFTEEDITKVLNYRLAVGLITQEAYAAALQALKIAENLAKIPDETIIVDVEYNDPGWSPPSGGGGGGVDPLVYPVQHGGDFWLTKPTLFLAGEAGPERAIFIPSDKAFDYTSPWEAVGQGKGGAGVTQIFNFRDNDLDEYQLRRAMARWEFLNS